MKFPVILSAFILLYSATLAAEAVDVAVSEGVGCALYEKGAVYCWGHLPVDEHDRPPFRAARVEALPPAISIAAGRFGVCSVDANYKLWCWGYDYQRSKRADEFIASKKPFLVEGLPRVRAASLGYSHVCALSLDGEVWCWGGNPCGEVGCGDRLPRGEPTKVSLPVRAVAVSAGINNSCAVLESHQVACWGSDNPTMHGKPFIYESSEPVFLDPAKVGLFKDVANGRNFACGIREDGRITCWGSNIMGQIGTKEPRIGKYIGIGEVERISRADDLDADYLYACAVSEGRVYCWGNLTFKVMDSGTWIYSPEIVSDVREATRVGIGPAFACAVNVGRVLCWGREHLEGTQTALIKGMHPDKPVPVPGLPD